MTYRERDIMHENGKFWVLRETTKRGNLVYKVLEIGATASTVRATYALGDAGLPRAIADS